MNRKRTRSSHISFSNPVPRRDALKGLGALAISLPILNTSDCESELALRRLERALENEEGCTLTVEDRLCEGPFLIEEQALMDDPTMVRSDTRDGHRGCTFQLYFRLRDAETCEPISNAEVYVWHCDADGYYSGFGDQNPDVPWMTPPGGVKIVNTERFCRGIQRSDDEGVVAFTSVYPGWYAGRPIHVHVMARLNRDEPRLITTQLYFAREFTDEVHANEAPYNARFEVGMYAASADPPAPESGSGPILSNLIYKPRPGSRPGLVVTALNLNVQRGRSETCVDLPRMPRTG